MRVALIVPCFNEALAIGVVLEEFAAVMPELELHVFDNNSSDGTAEVAMRYGAQVHSVRRQGKGNVVRRMFADVDADIYVMVDGDATYDASSLREHIDLMIAEDLDMVLGRRTDLGGGVQYRAGHRIGNRIITWVAMKIFAGAFEDMLSGYRIFSRRFVKSFGASSHGFETETELTVHALELRMACTEVPVGYRSRLEGSVSKLSTYRDGWRILRTIAWLISSEKPLAAFGAVGVTAMLMSFGMAVPLFLSYLNTGLVPRMPTAILAVGFMLFGVISLVCGVLLDHVTFSRREVKYLQYLRTPGLRSSMELRDC
ncbi:MAG: glycosyltransferase [Caldilineaceae bacterium]|nr:glycosyltransferase [Caldilineaceae bacterium]